MATNVLGVFGAATPWLASAGVALFVAVALIAFLQGREVSIWPPRIGARSGNAEELASGHAGDDTREYGVERANDFYQLIATRYDLRNSGNLVQTHLAALAELRAIRKRRDGMAVLDLGGGTGKLIAVHFFDDLAIRWTYVDFCPAMATEFRRYLTGTPLGRNTEVIVADLTRTVQELPAGSYDVILLSVVLSSMPDLPDFAPIVRLLAPDGSLIVSDIGPGYTHANPLYRVELEGGAVALRTTPVDPFEVVRRATAAGLQPGALRTSGEGNTYYSFMTVFTRQPVLRARPQRARDLTVG
jgi:ubiquinone/menaquinone biosynthesis C-methylase UbiE